MLRFEELYLCFINTGTAYSTQAAGSEAGPHLAVQRGKGSSFKAGSLQRGAELQLAQRSIYSMDPQSPARQEGDNTGGRG